MGFLLIKLIAFSDFNIPHSTSWTHKNVLRCKKHILFGWTQRSNLSKEDEDCCEENPVFDLKSVKNTLIKGAISFAIKRMSKSNF